MSMAMEVGARTDRSTVPLAVMRAATRMGMALRARMGRRTTRTVDMEGVVGTAQIRRDGAGGGESHQ